MAEIRGDVGVSVDIAATAQDVFELVSDPANYVTWSPEAAGIRRLSGSGTWQGGDSFTGKNNARLAWQTYCTITKSSLEGGFFFRVTAGPFPVAPGVIA